MSASREKAEKHMKRYVRNLAPIALSVVDDHAVVDVVKAAILGGKLPPEYHELALSYFSANALAFGKEHTTGIKDKDLALQQVEVSLSDRKRHN